MTKIPTAALLEPFYAAALAYGKASVEESETYRQAGHKTTPAVKRASRKKERLYQTIDDARQRLNAQFPGLNLFCPAPFVGFTGRLDSYKQYVEKRLPDYVCEKWIDQHKAEIFAIHEILRSIPETNDSHLNDIVFCNSALFRITRITPKRHKITALPLPDGLEIQLPRNYKRINGALAERMLKLHASKMHALKTVDLSP